MIESVVVNDDAIRLVFTNRNYSDKLSMLFTQNELNILNYVKSVLELFKQAITELSEDMYLTINLVIPAIKGIVWHLDRLHMKTDSGLAFLQDVYKKVEKCLNLYEERSISHIATLFDPRWKKAGFRFDKNYEESRKLL